VTPPVPSPLIGRDVASNNPELGRGIQGVELGRHTRRQMLKTAMGGTAGLLIGASARRAGRAQTGTASGAPVVQRLADDLFVVTIPGEANVLARTGPAGALLVDGASAAASGALLSAVASLPGGGAVQTIFNTHWHPEQTGSNEALGKAGRTIIAHENTRLWLTTDVTWSWNGRQFTRLPVVAQPNRTFYTTGTLEPASTEAPARGTSGVRYGHIPDAAHTDGDIYVHFIGPNVLAAGDAVSGQGWPVIDWATGGWIGGIVGGLQRLQTLADERTRIVPARGPVLGLADLNRQYEMYGTIYNRLTQLLNKGRGPDEAVAARPTKEFDESMGNGDEFVRRAFESLWAYLSPDA
jgi:cyclase